MPYYNFNEEEEFFYKDTRNLFINFEDLIRALFINNKNEEKNTTIITQPVNRYRLEIEKISEFESSEDRSLILNILTSKVASKTQFNKDKANLYFLECYDIERDMEYCSSILDRMNENPFKQDKIDIFIGQIPRIIDRIYNLINEKEDKMFYFLLKDVEELFSTKINYINFLKEFCLKKYQLGLIDDLDSEECLGSEELIFNINLANVKIIKKIIEDKYSSKVFIDKIPGLINEAIALIDKLNDSDTVVMQQEILSVLNLYGNTKELCLSGDITDIEFCNLL